MDDPILLVRVDPADIFQSLCGDNHIPSPVVVEHAVAG